MSNLALSDIVSISVSAVETGVGEYNTSNVALFTREVPGDTFGSLVYKIFKDPSVVAGDFGSDSATFKMANALFSQKPNILGNRGYLVILPMLTTAQTAVQEIDFSDVAASGTFILNHNGHATSALNYNDSASAIQTALRLLTGLGSVTVSGSIASKKLMVTFAGVSGATPLMTVSSNSLVDANADAITVTPVTTTIGSTAETLDKAILRTSGLVQYFGVMAAEVSSESVMLAAAAVIQAMNKIAFFVSYNPADIANGGMIDLLRSGGFTQSRGLYYGDVPATALVYLASYVGRALSVNFNGSNTASSIHLKSLAGVQPDPSMDETLLTLCQAAGADVYASIQGVSKTICSGANSFFDQVYNLQWFAGALQVAGFNYLAQVSTKVPQTEAGMSGLKGAYRQVCEQAVTNKYAAPGEWNSPSTFGNLDDLLSNISQRGYYIYSLPVSQQLPADRATRAAPIIQIAIKEAGAIHSSNVIVNVNA